MVQLTQADIDHFLSRWYGHMPTDVHAVVSKDIWDRHRAYQASGLSLNAYIADWELDRGWTMEYRVPEDISRHFYKQLSNNMAPSQASQHGVVDNTAGNDKFGCTVTVAISGIALGLVALIVFIVVVVNKCNKH